MKMLCEECKEEIEKPEKEIKRQLKKNPDRKFFCSTRCSCTYWNRLKPRKGNPESLKKGSSLDKFSPFRYFLNKSKHRNKENNLDLEYLKDLWEQQQGLCALSGKKLELPTNSGAWNKQTRDPWKPSLDRIDNSRGYIKGNVRFVCVAANIAKQTWPDAVLIELCVSITNNFKL